MVKVMGSVAVQLQTQAVLNLTVMSKKNSCVKFHYRLFNLQLNTTQNLHLCIAMAHCDRSINRKRWVQSVGWARGRREEGARRRNADVSVKT